jgi:hypothetical protein
LEKILIKSFNNAKIYCRIYSLESDTGILLYSTESVTWQQVMVIILILILQLARIMLLSWLKFQLCELYTSDLMNRFLVSESISSFDTAPVRLFRPRFCRSKMNKTLHMVKADEINKYIKGSFFKCYV